MRGAALLGCLTWLFACGAGESLPDYGRVADFTLTSQSGRSLSSTKLLGTEYVASFVFTSCRSICPMVMTHMRDLAARLAQRGSRARLVSISVDPEHDTPEVLAAYARQHGADPSRWTFLTGATAGIRRTVVGGFKQTMGERTGLPVTDAAEQRTYDIVHSARLVLVDRRGHMRGFFESSALGVQGIIRALDALASETAR